MEVALSFICRTFLGHVIKSHNQNDFGEAKSLLFNPNNILLPLVNAIFKCYHCSLHFTLLKENNILVQQHT